MLAAFFEQDADFYLASAEFLQPRGERAQRAARVEDIINDQHIAPMDGIGEAVQTADRAGAGCAGVAGKAHAGNLHVERDAAQEVGHEKERAVHHAQKDRDAARIVARNLSAENAHARGDFLPGNEFVPGGSRHAADFYRAARCCRERLRLR